MTPEQLFDAADAIVCPICRAGIEDECDEQLHGVDMKRYEYGQMSMEDDVLGDYVKYVDHLAALESVRKESAQRIAGLEATVEREHKGMLAWKKTVEEKDAEIIKLRKEVSGIPASQSQSTKDKS